MASRDDELVRRLAGPSELALALDLRAAVFCGEQGISLAAEQDGRDGEALHLGVFEGGALVGTCRILDLEFSEPIVQRVAVRADRRGRGFGRALIAGALVEAQRGGAAALTLHAQLGSEGFYRDQGFTREGRAFVEEGIEHVAMRRELRLS